MATTNHTASQAPVHNASWGRLCPTLRDYHIKAINTTTAEFYKPPVKKGSTKKEQETPKPDTPVSAALLAAAVEGVLGAEGEASPVVVPRAEARRHEGVFVSRGKEDHLLTRSMVPGIEVYGEKRVSVDGTTRMLTIPFYHQ
ncbi:hypothetical protein DL767_003372 [Monosporascus sp. MG133]|nr:hypothetical protein DL767_003372 [Monosporascus sp. MG133]